MPHRSLSRGQIHQALEDYIDESEVLTPVDEEHHVYKHTFGVPFVCGARNLGEALRRLGEGAAMIRSRAKPARDDVVEAVRHIRAITSGNRRLGTVGDERADARPKELRSAKRSWSSRSPAKSPAGWCCLPPAGIDHTRRCSR